MKKFLLSLLLTAAALVAPSVKAQGFRYDNIALNQNGGPITSASINICAGDVRSGPAPCSTTVPVYSDAALSVPLTQPLATGPLGNYGFFAAPGTYTISFYGTNVTATNDILTIPCTLTYPACAGAGGVPSFNAITAGTNTGQALVVGNGSALSATGTGTISATSSLTALTATLAGNLSGTPLLPNGTTAATQSAGDSSAKLATDAFVIANESMGSVALAATNTARYVQGINPGLSSGNGSDLNSGLSEGEGLGDLYTAMSSCVNTNPAVGCTIHMTMNGGISGPIFQTPAGLFPQNSSYTGWIGILGTNDQNYLSESTTSRNSGTVTFVATATIPTTGSPYFSPYYQVNNYVSVFECANSSFDGSVFQLTNVSGSTLQWAQSGSGSTTGCVVVPLGWVPQAGSGFNFQCLGGAVNGATGGPGSDCWIQENYAPLSVAITALSESGNLVTVTHAISSQFYAGLPVRVAYTPNSNTYPYDQFGIVNTVLSNTQFTIINPTSGLTSCASNCGYTSAAEPGFWFSGAQGISGDHLYITAALPLVYGVDSVGNPAYLGGNEGLNYGTGIGFHKFTNSSFATPSAPYSDLTFGPVVWDGSNNVWGGWFINDVFVANSAAPVLTDLRSAFLSNPDYNGTSGLQGGLLHLEDPTFLGGGGVRMYAGAGSGGMNLDAPLQEGVGPIGGVAQQSQPVLQVMNIGTFGISIRSAGTSDNGNTAPVVVIPAAIPPSEVTVCGENGGPGNIVVQGPATICGGTYPSASSADSTAYTGTVPLVSPAAMAQQGEGLGASFNFNTNVARRSFGPALQRYTNLAQGIPAAWTISEGSATVSSAVGPDGLTGSATKLVCNTPDVTLLYCAAQIYSGSQTYPIGDFAVADAYISAADHSAGHYGGNEFGLNCCSNFPYTAFGAGAGYRSNQGSLGYNSQVGGATADDGSWQHEYFWLQSAAAAGSETIDLEVRFDVLHPLIVYNTVHYYKITGSQVATPAAPTLGSSASGSLAQTNYYVRTTYTNATGETNVQSTDTILNVAANHILTVTCPGASTGATGCNVYVGGDATCAQGGRATVMVGYDATGPGEVCELKQNATPIAVNGTWTESTSGLNTTSTGYQGARGPAGQMEPTTDTTNVVGQSEVADLAGAIPMSPPPITIGHLPSASNNPSSILTISDGMSSTDCTTGGGSTTVVCFSNGTAWGVL